MRATLEERVVFHFVRRGFHHDRRLRVVFRVNTRDAVDRKDIIFVASFFVHQNVRRGKYNASAVVRKPQFRGFDDRNYIVTALDIIERSRSMSEHGCRRPRIRHDTDFRCIRAGRRNLRAQQWIVLRISHGRDDTTKQLFDEIFAHFLAHQLAGIDADVLNRDVVDTSTPGDKTRIVDVQFQIRPRLVGIGRVAAAGFRRDLDTERHAAARQLETNFRTIEIRNIRARRFWRRPDRERPRIGCRHLIVSGRTSSCTFGGGFTHGEN